MEEWNETAVEVRGVTLPELFEEQVEKTPEAVAVVYEDSKLSYGELNERANRLARYLFGGGVGPESLVGIAMERSLELIVGLWGTLKAGAAYLPLDRSYPAARLMQMLEEARPVCVLVTSKSTLQLPVGSLRIIVDGNDIINRLDNDSSINPSDDREKTVRSCRITRHM